MNEILHVGDRLVNIVIDGEEMVLTKDVPTIQRPKKAKIDVSLDNTPDYQKVMNLYQDQEVTVYEGSSGPKESTDLLGLTMLGIATSVNLSDLHPPEYLYEILNRAEIEWKWKVTNEAWLTVLTPTQLIGRKINQAENALKGKLSRHLK